MGKANFFLRKPLSYAPDTLSDKEDPTKIKNAKFSRQFIPGFKAALYDDSNFIVSVSLV